LILPEQGTLIVLMVAGYWNLPTPARSAPA